jgi:alpha-ketoglutarate-dependent taurine dioxygenase
LRRDHFGTNITSMSRIEIVDFEAPFGAEVKNFNPREALDDEQWQLLWDAFDRRSLLLFRDLDIDYPGQSLLSDTLAGIEHGPDVWDDDPESHLYVSNTREGAVTKFGRLLFHSDMAWAEHPLEVLSLYAVEIEEPAVPTFFASTANAWQTLPEDLRAEVEGLAAYHSAGQYKRDPDDDLVEAVPEQPKSVIKPLAHPHPRAGGTILYCNEQMTRYVVDVAPETSERLLAELFEHLYAPENVVAHQWHEQDLVVIDNLAVQHARPNVTADGATRTLRRFVGPLSEIPEQDRASFVYSPMSK